MQQRDHITLVVLPFEDLSLGQDQGVFARSFDTDLSTELSRFRQFQIIRLSGLNSDDPSLLEQILLPSKTDYYIRGTVRFESDLVRINVQLYNSETQHMVWGDRFEGNVIQLKIIQEELLTSVIGVLQHQINSDLIAGIRKRPKVEFRAYEHWLIGMEEVKKGGVENDLVARDHFQKAMDIQPDYSFAYSGMSLTYFNEWSCQLYDRWDVSRTGAYEWAQKAIELDDQNHIAAAVLGRLFLYEGSYGTAEYYLRKALLLNPNDPDTLIQIALGLAYLGAGEESIDLYEKTIRLTPFNAEKYFSSGLLIFFELGELEKAASLILRSQHIKMANAEAYYAAIYHYLGQNDKVLPHWKKFLDTYRKLISKGEDFSEQEAISWIMKINPHKNKTRLEDFLKHILNSSSTIQETVDVQRNASSMNEMKVLNYFVRETSSWKLSYEGHLILIPDLKGLHDIHKMLMEPRHQFHCAELMESTIDTTGQKLLDETARKQYQKKLRDLKNQMQEAEQSDDFSRLEALQEEYDLLIRHLSQSLGLKGKSRETGSTVEKARSAVTWRIRNAIARVEQSHPMLGAHLSNAIKTGILCSYQPDRELSWITS